MKGIIFIALVILTCVGTPTDLLAQFIATDSSAKIIYVSPAFKDAELHTNSVKKKPEFLGGKKAWHEFLKSNINLATPILNKAKPGSYWVMIRFIIGSNGKLSSIGPDTNCGYGMEKEVIRCIQKSPDWIAAEIGSGRKVSFIMRTGLTFVVKQNDVNIIFQ